jgi:hypothetical protein
LDDSVKKIPVTVVVPELQFFEIEGKFLRISAVVFQQPFLGKRPESLNPIDVDLTVGESLSMIDSPMFESIGDKTIVTPESISS